jgi:hypothetical protein
LVWAVGELLKKRKNEERHTQNRYISPTRGETPSQPIFTISVLKVFGAT